LTNTGGGASDNNLCTEDNCLSGQTDHPIVSDDDGNECTLDGCDPITGVYHIPPTAGQLSDGDVCTMDVCNSITGQISHDPIDVSDGNPCTLDGCNSITGLSHLPDPNLIVNDNNACTLDGCNTITGQETHQPISGINDNNPCTIDACNSINGSISHIDNSPVVSLSQTPSGCNNNGTATASPSGGTPGYLYIWNPTGQTTQTATGLAPNTYTVVVTDANGCTTSQSIAVQSTGSGSLSNPIITGPVSVCPMQTITYTIAAVPNATSYQWSFPTRASGVVAANQLSAVVTYNNNFPSPTLANNRICVTAVGPCGSSQTCIQISKGITTAPVINGPVLVCRNQTYTYSVVPVPGATSYVWEFPTRATGTVAANGLSASVAYTGSVNGPFPSSTPSHNDICVTAVGPCGNSQTCIIIALDPNCPPCVNPAPPVINGPVSVCPMQTITYTIAAVPNATSYQWSFPTRSTGVVAANQLSAVVTYNTKPNSC
jgi:hypothetical protein